MNTQLTDMQGASLGTALDRIEGIERIAGQYAGRGGDEQFRLYVHLKPDTREVLEKSKEFFQGPREHGLPRGLVRIPTGRRARNRTSRCRWLRTGSRADIDVDYPRQQDTPKHVQLAT